MAAETYPLKFKRSEVSRIVIGHTQGMGARGYQEDSFGYTKREEDGIGFLAVVADGMGGLSNGGEISADVVAQMLLKSRQLSPQAVVHAEFARTISNMNDALMGDAVRSGSTVAAVYCRRDGVFWCCVGDSRVYLFRGGGLTPLNEDSDYFNVLLRKVLTGEMSYAQAMEDPQKDALAQYIGRRGAITPDCNRRPLRPVRKDKLLLCSDGVYNGLSEEELAALLRLPPQSAADEISKNIMKKNNPKQDNFTAVILEFR
ncbi:MAG: serine/threonine-protein phosphatase [Roseburia sp.]|nr:serine/threonine-protein phosphatase [Roseburia sp.]